MTEPLEETQESTSTDAQDASDIQARYIRSLADLENLRKRMDSERAMIRQLAVTGVIQEFLPVVDNFTRAIEHIPEAQLSLPWVTGIQHIQRQLQDALANLGVKAIPVSIGDTFDLTIHEAVEAVDNSGLPADQVASVLQSGYKMGDKVIRPARVTVSTQDNN